MSDRARNSYECKHNPPCPLPGTRYGEGYHAARERYGSAPALAPYYEADGSTVMLPAEEVERRRKLAAKVIGAVRRWRHAMAGSKAERASRGMKELARELMRASRDLDAPSPGAPGDAGTKGGA
jgi:hypothetical protein